MNTNLYSKTLGAPESKVVMAGRDSSVGIATCYALDCPGIEFHSGENFRTCHPASYTMSTGFFPGVKRPGRGVGHPPPSSAEVKEIVELYLYSYSGPL